MEREGVESSGSGLEWRQYLDMLGQYAMICLPTGPICIYFPSEIARWHHMNSSTDM